MYVCGVYVCLLCVFVIINNFRQKYTMKGCIIKKVNGTEKMMFRRFKILAPGHHEGPGQWTQW